MAAETMHTQVVALPRPQSLCGVTCTGATTAVILNCPETRPQILSRPGKPNPEGRYWVQLGLEPRTLFISLGLVPTASHLCIKFEAYLRVFKGIPKT